GAVSVKLGGSGPSLMLESVPALITGALSFETPPGGQAVTETTRFHRYPSENAARTAPGPHAVPYRIVLTGGPHGLATGASVKLEGADVGTVTGVAMHYDPAAGRISTRIDIVLEPDDIPLAPPHGWNLANPTPQMNAMLTTLIAHGLRARMASSTPVVGGKIIELDMVKGAASAGLGAGSPPEIPSVPGSSVNRIMAQVSTVLANIQDATGKIAAVSNSPRTKRTLERLDRTITHIDAITRTADARLPQLLAQLRKSTKEADAALRSANDLMSQQGGAAAGPESQTLPRALYELTRAAKSLRELTDYLSGHPNALILGKGR
ncbi:MAG TPA: MlaD family protein, partial [Acidiphilium sp.]